MHLQPMALKVFLDGFGERSPDDVGPCLLPYLTPMPAPHSTGDFQDNGFPFQKSF